MKIVELKAENVKRLSAVEIRPDGALVIVGGQNGAGKSSVLDSIEYALGGAARLPGRPVRRGADAAEISIELDSDPPLVVRRRISAAGRSTLEIRQVAADGTVAKLASPQKILDALVGTIAFDPLEFMRLPRAEQVETLEVLLGLDLAELDARESDLFDARRIANRDVKTLTAQAEACEYHDGLEGGERRAADVIAEIDAAQQANATIAQLQRDAQSAADAAQARAGDVRQAQAIVEGLKKQLQAAEVALASALEQFESASTRAADAWTNFETARTNTIDLSPLRKKLANTEEHNRKVRANAKRAELESAVGAAAARARNLSEQLEQCRAERAEKLAAAKWPVDGLSFDDGGVSFDGLPFAQCSSAEQLRISAAIGLAQHPRLRVLLIRGGSLLDEQNLAAFGSLAAEHDAQVWIERVGAGAECSVVIEDGAAARAGFGDAKMAAAPAAAEAVPEGRHGPAAKPER